MPPAFLAVAATDAGTRRGSAWWPRKGQPVCWRKAVRPHRRWPTVSACCPRPRVRSLPWPAACGGVGVAAGVFVSVSPAVAAVVLGTASPGAVLGLAYTSVAVGTLTGPPAVALLAGYTSLPAAVGVVGLVVAASR